MTRSTLLLAFLLCAPTARADATLFILHGGVGRTIIGERSFIVTSGPDGSIDFYDVREGAPSTSADALRARTPAIPAVPGAWTWRLHSKAGTETGSGQCTGHTEQRTGTDGGGVFVWLDCVPVANTATDPR